MGDAYLLCGTSFGNGQGDTEDCVGAKLALVGGSVERVEEAVDLGLVFDIEVLSNESRTQDGVDIGNSLADTLASPLSLVTIAEFNSLMLACDSRLQQYFGRRKGVCSGRTGRGARGDDGPVQAGLSDDVDLDGGVTTRVVDRTSVNLGNGHVDGLRGVFGFVLLRGVEARVSGLFLM